MNQELNINSIGAEQRHKGKTNTVLGSSCSSFDLSTSSLGTIDLPKNYQNAVECLIQCESTINTLQHQLASKDKQIASLARLAPLLEGGHQSLLLGDESTHLQIQENLLASKEEHITKLEERINNLEERLVIMSLELASTKEREGQLQHELRKSFTESDDRRTIISSSSDINEGQRLGYDSATAEKISSMFTPPLPPHLDGSDRSSSSFQQIGQFLFRKNRALVSSRDNAAGGGGR